MHRDINQAAALLGLKPHHFTQKAARNWRAHPNRRTALQAPRRPQELLRATPQPLEPINPNLLALRRSHDHRGRHCLASQAAGDTNPENAAEKCGLDTTRRKSQS